MVEILYIKIFQPFAQYRNPFTFYYAQTYPLPPKSTIIGMLQNITNKYYDDTFWELKISIHGGFETTFWNYQQFLKGEFLINNNGILLNKHDKNQIKNVWYPVYGENIKTQRAPVIQQELFNGHLYLFIRGDENLLSEIKNSIEKPKKVISLGRSEDIIFIRDIKTEKELIIEERTVSSIWFLYPTYIKQKVRNSSNITNFPIKNKKFPVYSIPVKIKYENKIKNKAEINKNMKRCVKFETVIYTYYDYIIELKKEIKMDIIKIGDKHFKIPRDFGWL